MRYTFPATRFVTENNADDQIRHVVIDFWEFIEARDESVNEKEEAMDLYHSLETLFRIWEREGVDIEAVRRKVLEKNRERGYYAAP